jgi:hypothetical protein
VTGAGLFLLFTPEFAKASISWIAGISLLIYGLGEFLSSWKMKKAIDEYRINEVKDVEYEKVDEQ